MGAFPQCLGAELLGQERLGARGGAADHRSVIETEGAGVGVNFLLN